eukprot:1179070-Prorocentrum_minimum.AAC.4
MLNDSLHMERVAARKSKLRPSAVTFGMLIDAYCNTEQVQPREHIPDARTNRTREESIYPASEPIAQRTRARALKAVLVGQFPPAGMIILRLLTFDSNARVGDPPLESSANRPSCFGAISLRDLKA